MAIFEEEVASVNNGVDVVFGCFDDRGCDCVATGNFLEWWMMKGRVSLLILIV